MKVYLDCCCCLHFCYLPHLKLPFVCQYAHNTSKDLIFLYNFPSKWGDGKGIKVTALYFKKNLIYLQYLKKGPKWRRRFLNFLGSFIRFLWNFFLIYHSWQAFCKNCLSGKISVLELWIKKILTNNIAWFFKFSILAFFHDFVVDNVIPWGQKVKRNFMKLLSLTINIS